MFVTVMCDNDDCAYYRDGSCGKEAISIGRRMLPYFEHGDRGISHDCEDFKEVGYGLSD